MCYIRTLSSSIPFPIDDVPVRQYKSTKPVDSQDPDSYRPKADGIHVKLILKEAVCKGWLKKYKKPTFMFRSAYKKRYVLLVDRMLYTFKSETPNTYREYFEMTAETEVYLSDRFSKTAYCIEISKKTGSESGLTVWLLQTEDAETMKVWLSYLKQTVCCLKRGHQDTARPPSKMYSTLSSLAFYRKKVLDYLPPQPPPPTSLLPPIPHSSD
ncbi:hypothetical protein BY458DRAFT_536060 [Sporodiniella umbellata]|nr:hypothetical protein BY458DRAFT_536060 [Sporodiniella umbellata]